jgi:predicted metal-dependent phosphoesterase TrpH
MKLDAHVHTHHSGNTTIYPMSKIMKESYNTPEKLYRLAKARGMDLVTITDHDSIEGALTIAHRDDVIIGCEVTAIFAEDGTQCHIGVLGINETQHREIQMLRRNVRELAAYLKQQGIFSTLNHLASLSAGRLTAAQIVFLLRWISAVETLNGTRLRSQNQTANALAQAYGKVTVGGSDSHTYRGIGRTYMVSERARNREEFMSELRAGRVSVEGAQGHHFLLTSDIIRLTAGMYRDSIKKLIDEPLNWQRQLMVLCMTLGWPLTAVAALGSMIHYVRDEQYNHGLILDLVSQPAYRPMRLPVQALESAV